MSRLSRGRSRSCCASRPLLMAWLSRVMALWASAVTSTVSLLADLELASARDAAGRAHDHALALRLREAGEGGDAE